MGEDAGQALINQVQEVADELKQLVAAGQDALQELAAKAQSAADAVRAKFGQD